MILQYRRLYPSLQGLICHSKHGTYIHSCLLHKLPNCINFRRVWSNPYETDLLITIEKLTLKPCIHEFLLVEHSSFYVIPEALFYCHISVHKSCLWAMKSVLLKTDGNVLMIIKGLCRWKNWRAFHDGDNNFWHLFHSSQDYMFICSFNYKVLNFRH